MAHPVFTETKKAKVVQDLQKQGLNRTAIVNKINFGDFGFKIDATEADTILSQLARFPVVEELTPAPSPPFGLSIKRSIGVKKQREGDTRINPLTGKKEFFNPEGVFQEITAPGQAVGTEQALVGLEVGPQAIEARNKAAAEANQAAQTIFDSINDTDIESRKSSQLLLDLQERLRVKPPKAPSLTELFQSERERLGLEPLETELADIDSDIDRINTTLLVEAEKAGERLVSTREITRRRGTLQKRAEQRIALLNVERGAVARQLSNKLNTLEMIMNITNKDFQNASDVYEKEFNRNIQIIKLIQGEEAKEQTRIDRARDDARANLTTLQNIFKDSNTSYDGLTLDQKLSIQKLEIQAGFPVGLTAQIMNSQPDKKIKTVSSSTDEEGNVFFDVLLVGKNNELSVEKILRGKSAPSEDTDKITDEDQRAKDFELSRQFIKDNPDASREELRTGIRGKTKLGISDVNNLLDELEIIKEEFSLNDEQLKSAAIGIMKSVASLKLDSKEEKEKAIEFIRDSGFLNITIGKGADAKKKQITLTKQQRDKIIEIINKEFPEGRSFFQRLLLRGK